MEKSSLEIIKEYVENMRRDGDSNLVNILNQIYKAIEIEKLRNKDGGHFDREVSLPIAEMMEVLDKHLGDTDPQITDDWTEEEIKDEHPIYWVFTELNKFSQLSKRPS